MTVNYRPLNRSITFACVIFIFVLCVVISLVDYTAFYKGLYERNRFYLTDLLHYIDRNIDKDDLAECTRTKEESEMYKGLQFFLDSIVDNYNIDFVYIIKPLNTEKTRNYMVIINGISKKEYENDYEDLYFLGDVPDDSFPPSVMHSFFEAMENPGEVSFDQDKEPTEWGYDYTGMLPLQDSNGEVFGLLCVDISVTEIRKTLINHMIFVLSLILGIGTLFCICFILWSRQHITYPVKALEKSVSEFALTSHNQTDPALLAYTEPDIHTKNEVESLSHAVSQMTSDIKTYATNILAAEKKVSNLQQNVAKLDVLAYQDALTHVKNKTAYDNAILKLNEKIASGTAKFGIVMIDLNHLKHINDTYGHEKGNEYILGACHIVCEIYEHSPVFRIGGDEFVVVLENRDYENRNELFNQMQKSFEESKADESRDPWLRYSAAFGMEVYSNKPGVDVESVFKAADKIMYDNKIKMHEGR
ncbi:MAG: GGDEF domain-containing protein [Treponema sp.]|nr:GGDEF domain-containing protein [Treponema sp.]